jgi:hypothetical protein
LTALQLIEAKIPIELDQGLLAASRIDHGGTTSIGAEKLPHHLTGDVVGW